MQDKVLRRIVFKTGPFLNSTNFMVLVYKANNGSVWCNICWPISEDNMSNIVLTFRKHVEPNVRSLSKIASG